MEHIGEIARRPIKPEPPGVDAPATVPTGRIYSATPLAEFKFEHLEHEWQRQRLQKAISTCFRWIENHAQPGLALVLAGPYGTGKTTMADNVAQVFVSYRVPDGEQRLDNGDLVPLPPIPVRKYRRFQATELMRVVADSTFTQSLQQFSAFVIDDAGDEDFSTPTYTPNEDVVRNTRQRRYRLFFDWCYHTGRHMIITSNVPCVYREDAKDPASKVTGFNGDFMDIFGGAGFSRLIQMAQGYVISTDGLMDYRPFIGVVD